MINLMLTRAVCPRAVPLPVTATFPHGWNVQGADEATCEFPHIRCGDGLLMHPTGKSCTWWERRRSRLATASGACFRKGELDGPSYAQKISETSRGGLARDLPARWRANCPSGCSSTSWTHAGLATTSLSSLHRYC